MSLGSRSPSEVRIVVVGSLNLDLVAFADRLPEAGETVLGTRYLEGFGGKGANQAVAAARFGADVSMVGAVGDDPNGRAILDNLARQHVHARDVALVSRTTGVAPIWVDGSGANRIIVIPGANDLVSADGAAAAVDRIRPSVVVGQFEIPQATTRAAFEAARTIGAVTILNPAPGAPIDPALIAVSDWIVPNETELVAIGGRPLTGRVDEQAAAIDDLGQRLAAGLIVTLGERGAAIRPDGGPVTWVNAPPAHAVDTSGAGDAFVGALAVGLGLGWPVEAAVRLGCAAASDSVTRSGTQASYATPDDATALLATMRPT